MKLKTNLLSLAAVGVLGMSVNFAQADSRSVAIENLKLVQEKGTIVATTDNNHHHHHHHHHHGHHGHHGHHRVKADVNEQQQLPSPQVNKG